MQAQTSQVVQIDPSSPWFAASIDLLEQADKEQVGEAADPQSVGYAESSWVTSRGRRLGWVSVSNDEVLATAQVYYGEVDNTHLAELELFVRQDARGQGMGRELLQTATAACRALGRDTLLGSTGYRSPPEQVWALHEQVVKAPESSPQIDPTDVPGVAFARAAGAVIVQTEVRSRVFLPVSHDLLRTIDEEVTAHAGGYRIIGWHEQVPAELLADKAHLNGRMSTDAPMADVDWREEVWDPARVLKQYEDMRNRGLRVVGAGAVSSKGQLVAFSEMAQDTRHPDRAHQMDTIVDPDHRGHRVGMAVKAANLRELASAAPEVDQVATWNALENGPMLRVNRAMGFVPVGLYALWQLTLT